MNDELQKKIEQAVDAGIEKAILRLRNQAYEEVGRSVISKCLYGIGAVLAGLELWLASKGMVK